MNITAFSIEQILDPTNIIEGKRFELLLDVEVEEDDELYSQAGIEIRVIAGVIEQDVRVMSYFIIDKADNSYLDFELEEDELALILTFCKEQLIAGSTEA